MDYQSCSPSLRHFLWPRLYQRLLTMGWKEKAHLRRQQQVDAIPVAWRLKEIPQGFKDSRPIIEGAGILTPRELDITNTVGADKILRKIEDRSWSSEEVATAFCKRAALAEQLTRCCTEMMFESAIAQARELDKYLERTGRLFGPLHGLPLSLKDTHEVKGYDTTVGWVGLIGKPAAQDNVAVQQYRGLGAVIYCKTNIPQSLMMSDSYNHVFGQSVNSLNQTLISGGSSGGEGALIGAHGSVIGIGTDIGGSIRIPAVLQGIWGLCPTIGRVPNRESGKPQKYVVPPVAGPMASSVSSIELFMDAYLSSEPWNTDPQIYPVPWRRDLAQVIKRPLRIAYIVDDGVVLPQPPVQRAVREVVDKLKSCGHEVIAWDYSSHKGAYYDLWLPAVLADGGQKCADLCTLEGEPLIQGMLVGTPDTALDNTRRQELAERIWEYQKDYLSRWQESAIDALIMPVTPWAGMKPKTWVQSEQYCGYTSIWNLLNYTALAFPATTVSKRLDQPDPAWAEHQGRSFSDQFNHDQYDIDLVDGMPVGLQIVTGRFGEEKAVAVAKVIESLP